VHRGTISPRYRYLESNSLLFLHLCLNLAFHETAATSRITLRSLSTFVYHYPGSILFDFAYGHTEMRATLWTNVLIFVALVSASLVSTDHHGIFVEQESSLASTLTAQHSSESLITPASSPNPSATATTAAQTVPASESAKPSASQTKSSLPAHSTNIHATALSTTDPSAVLTSGLTASPTGTNGMTICYGKGN
jgi:hypothetical protein